MDSTFDRRGPIPAERGRLPPPVLPWGKKRPSLSTAEALLSLKCASSSLVQFHLSWGEAKSLVTPLIR